MAYLVLLCSASVLYFLLSSYVGDEVRDNLYVWLEFIQSNERWRSLAYSFHNYSGPYVTLLVAFSYLDGLISNLHIIKLLSVCGVLFGSYLIWKIARDYADERIPPAIIAGAFLFTPTIVVNSAVWGQADIFYSWLLMLSLYLILKNRLLASVVVFGLAFSFKMQAVFFSPFLLMVFVRDRKSVLYFALIPIVYLLANAPLLLAGRSLIDVLLIYPLQGAVSDRLATQSPNPWFWIYGALNDFPVLYARLYPYLIAFGLVATSIAGLAIASLGIFKKEFSIYQNILVATLCVALMPFLLPKMHDRFFFAADLFSILLFIVRPRLWSIAAAFQLGSLCAYVPYFINDFASKPLVVVGPMIGSVFISYAIMSLTFLVAVEFQLLRIDWMSRLSNILKKIGLLRAEPQSTWVVSDGVLDLKPAE